MNRRLGLIGAALALALALPAGSLAAPATGSQFAGIWVGIDPGDGSTQLLQVAAGPTPQVVYQDFYARGCDNNGSPSTHWVAAGRGEVDGDVLWVSYHKSGCGFFTIGGYGDFVVYDAGTDTLTGSDGGIYYRM